MGFVAHMVSGDGRCATPTIFDLNIFRVNRVVVLMPQGVNGRTQTGVSKMLNGFKGGDVPVILEVLQKSVFVCLSHFQSLEFMITMFPTRATLV